MTEGERILEVPPGHLAAVVTHLFCRRPVPVPPRPEGVELLREADPAPAFYKALFRRVGGDWLWTSRLLQDDAALAAMLARPEVELHIVRLHGAPCGLVELDLADPGRPRVILFGVAQEAMGRGIGRWLMPRLQQMLFEAGAETIGLDTCTLDSPGALRFYLRNGFEAERREVRIFPDPRDDGVLDTGAAPHVPRL